MDNDCRWVPNYISMTSIDLAMSKVAEIINDPSYVIQSLSRQRPGAPMIKLSGNITVALENWSFELLFRFKVRYRVGSNGPMTSAFISCFVNCYHTPATEEDAVKYGIDADKLTNGEYPEVLLAVVPYNLSDDTIEAPVLDRFEKPDDSVALGFYPNDAVDGYSGYWKLMRCINDIVVRKTSSDFFGGDTINEYDSNSIATPYKISDDSQWIPPELIQKALEYDSRRLKSENDRAIMEMIEKIERERADYMKRASVLTDYEDGDDGEEIIDTSDARSIADALKNMSSSQ